MAIDSKIIGRIRKLLAMAADTSSPNEAAIAARRAEGLMRQHNIESADAILGELKQKENIVQQSARGNIWRAKARSIPTWSQTMAVYTAELFDCHVVQVHSETQGRTLRFMGYHTDVEVCIWTFTYLLRQCARFADRYAESNPTANRAEKMAYHDGVAHGIWHNLREAKKAKDAADRSSSSCTALVVAKRAAIEDAFGKVNYTDGKAKKREGAAAYANMMGWVDGRSINVNPNVIGQPSEPKAPAIDNKAA